MKVMKKSVIQDLIKKIQKRHTKFDVDALITLLNQAKGEAYNACEGEIEDSSYLREQYEVFFNNGGFYFENMWDSMIMEEGSKDCVLDYDIIREEFERQSNKEQDAVQELLSKYADEYPIPLTHQVGFDFDECFIRFLDNERFDMSIMFANRLLWWYQLHMEYFY